MGGGASKKKEEEPKATTTTTEHPDTTRVKELELKLKEKEDQIKKLKEESAVKASGQPPELKEGEGGILLIVTKQQYLTVKEVPDVQITLLNQSAELGELNPIIVTGTPDGLKNIPQSVVQPVGPLLTRKPKPVPEAAVFGEKKEEEKKDEEEQPKKEVAKPTIKCSTSIKLGKWEGKVPVRFNWVVEASPYSEFNDPSGSNWSRTANVRSAVGAPQKVQVEWRQGMTGKWAALPECTYKPEEHEFQYIFDIQPTKVEASEYRGFQSRFLVDGDRYLSPLQLAPTLQSKLMAYPIIRNAVKSLPPDKQSLENIPNEDVRKAVLAVENIVPMNTWDISYGVQTMPGAYLEGEHIMTLFEKAEFMARMKTSDPALQAELRKNLLKSPITIANAALGTIGVNLSAMIGKLDEFFLPKCTEPDFEALEKLEQDDVAWENLRREMQSDVNGMYPTYQAGLRVTFPPAHVMKSAIKCKRPTIHEPSKVTLPVTFAMTLEDDTYYTAKHKISVTYWDGANDVEGKHLTNLELEAPEEKESFGVVNKEEKAVWKNYTKTIPLPAGRYHYYFLVDGKPFFSDGKPFDSYSPDTKKTYCVFSVEMQVIFGIGVAV